MTKMTLPYDDANKVKILANEQVSIAALATPHGKLIQNDLSLRPDKKFSPGVWECRWFNSGDPSSYYKKGDAVWINTEHIDDFVVSHEDDIYVYCINNSMLAYDAKTLRSTDVNKWREFCVEVVTGKYSPDLPPLYYLGDINANAQIRISMIDENSTLPSIENVDKGYWKDFFIVISDEEVKQIVTDAYRAELKTLFDKHIQSHHLVGQIDLDDDDMPFLKRDFSNVTKVQSFETHSWIDVQTTGLDYVVQKYYLQSDAYPLQWFRIWHSGMLEHGGIVNAGSSQKPITIDFAWPYDDGGTGKTAPTYDYPTLGLRNYYSYSDLNVYYDTVSWHDLLTDSSSDKISPQCRYSVSITPVYSLTNGSPYVYNPSSNTYCSRETCNYTNTSFQIVPDGHASQYRYYVRGYSAQYRKFI